MNSPLVSVIVPAYNQADYLRACLDHLWFQDYGNLEIVVVNDGATDHTAEVIQAFEADLSSRQTSYASYYNDADDVIERAWHSVYAAAGRTLQVITHPRNRGLAAALNTGVAACRGRYCTYVPSDDIAWPDMISALVAALESGPADFAYADMLIVNDQMQILRHFKLPEYSFQSCFGDWYLCGVCKLYARELHERLGGYDETLLAHDHELFQRFAMNGARFVHVARALMAVRDHDRERQVDIHAPANWNRLLEESKVLVRQARAFLQSGAGN